MSAGSGTIPKLPSLGSGHVLRSHHSCHASSPHCLHRPPLQPDVGWFQQAVGLLPQNHDEGHIQPGGAGRGQIHPRYQTRWGAFFSAIKQDLPDPRKKQTSGPQLLVSKQLLWYELSECCHQPHHSDHTRVWLLTSVPSSDTQSCSSLPFSLHRGSLQCKEFP